MLVLQQLTDAATNGGTYLMSLMSHWLLGKSIIIEHQDQFASANRLGITGPGDPTPRYKTEKTKCARSACHSFLFDMRMLQQARRPLSPTMIKL